MLDEAALALLRRPDVLVYLATTNPDGSPNVSPLWSDVSPDGSEVWLNSAEGRRKVLNVRRDPRVMLAAHDPGDLYPPLLIRGTVVGLEHDGADAHIDALARRYTGSGWGSVADQVRVILRIRPDSVSFED